MHFRQIYLLIITTVLFITGCEKLPSEPSSTISDIKTDASGVNYWGQEYNDFGHAVIQTADGGYAVVGSQYSTETQEDLILVKFGSDLDASTQQQLRRGDRLVELLKQSQYEPMPVERQIASIFCGSNGYLDDLDLHDLARFESEFLVYRCLRDFVTDQLNKDYHKNVMVLTHNT